MPRMSEDPDDAELARSEQELQRLRAAAGRVRGEHTQLSRQLERLSGQLEHAQHALEERDRLAARVAELERAYTRLRRRRGVRAALSAADLASATVARLRRRGHPSAAAAEAPSAVTDGKHVAARLEVATPLPPRPGLREHLISAIDAEELGRVVVRAVGDPAAVGLLVQGGWLDAANTIAPSQTPADVLVVTDPASLGPDLARHAVVAVLAVGDAWVGNPWLELADVVLADEAVAATMGHAPAAVVDDHAQSVTRLAGVLRRWAVALQVAVIVGTPDWEQAAQWGDTFYGRALVRELENRGHPAQLHFRDTHTGAQADRADLAIHLLGLSAPRPKPHQVNVLWVISHPELATPQRCGLYDLVGIASRTFIDPMTRRLPLPVVELPQATDANQFRPEAGGEHHELLFVGNSRLTRRRIIDDLTPTTHDLAIYGLGWEPDLADPRHVRHRLIPNAELHRSYAAADIVLNDHWPEMARQGFISNRLYDASAAGAFVISDHVAGIVEHFDGGVVTYRGRADLHRKVDAFLADPGLRAEHAARARAAVLDRHTFSHRIDRILELVQPTLDARVSVLARERARADATAGPA